ncbi:VirB6/TrbL-like conjugal transfer protein, CD1112 family [Paenibacillus gallinarum]|uniref:TrbL/VirB6 plasmid conjugal transfer protein n=1 Tax=Paenibacillus gallinarum TaxID=2762232 RepID=A0ABR8T689_9BACL|nr:CD0415/CD1112 family protein [Paenibacillus gallinarum]MBD7971115.1 hypothetical protein [Paenibacillus gallinarum]
MAENPIDNLKEDFEGFTDLVGSITDLVNQGPSTYPSLYAVIENIHEAILPVAYSLLALYFLLDLVNKSMNFAFFRWETVVSCLVKLIFAKFVMESTFELLEAIFGISAYVTNLVGVEGSSLALYDINWSAMEDDYQSAGWFQKQLYEFKLMPFQWALQAVKIVITLVIFGRLFELLIYTAVAPIPIATFIHDSLSSTGKRFIMDYAAVCLQGIIIIVGCVVYASIATGSLFGGFTGSGGNIELWKGLLSALALLLVVIKSGSWARKLTGA